VRQRWPLRQLAEQFTHHIGLRAASPFAVLGQNVEFRIRHPEIQQSLLAAIAHVRRIGVVWALYKQGCQAPR